MHTWSGVPVNRVGYSYAKDGNNYVGFMIFSNGINNDAKEYISQNLSQPLQAGKEYCLTFYVSRADRKAYSIENIGAYFSNLPPALINGAYINATPQVENQNGFITDTVGWTEISGCFTANGGEQYVTFGNFNTDANTSFFYSGTTNPVPNNPEYAYYYIDDITLVEQTATSVREQSISGKTSFAIQPNPNNGEMLLMYNLGNYANANVEILDITGKVIQTYTLNTNVGNLIINEPNMSNGIYFYRIFANDSILKTDKIVIIK